jgi:hypothetical protein
LALRKTRRHWPDGRVAAARFSASLQAWAKPLRRCKVTRRGFIRQQQASGLSPAKRQLIAAKRGDHGRMHDCLDGSSNVD